MNISRMGRMTPVERRMGRFLRAPDGHPDGGTDSGTGENNGGGNSGESNGDSNSQNNTGQAPDGTQFWNEPPEDSNANGNNNDGSDDSQQFGQTINETIQGLNFGELFTADIGTQIQEGDLTGINDRFQELGRSMVTQSVQQSIRIMQRFGAQLLEQSQAQISEALGGRDNDSELVTAFPAAMKDPASAPLVKQVFTQAMKHTKGDRKGAIEMTRSMLSMVGKGAREDLGIPNSNPDDFMGEGSNLVNLDSLLGR